MEYYKYPNPQHTQSFGKSIYGLVSATVMLARTAIIGAVRSARMYYKHTEENSSNRGKDGLVNILAKN